MSSRKFVVPEPGKSEHNKPHTFLKFRIETFSFDENVDDGTIHRIDKIYPLEFLDESNHTFLTYEILEQLKEMRKALKK